MKYLKQFENVGETKVPQRFLDKYYPDLYNIDDYFQSFADTNPDLFVDVWPCLLPGTIVGDRGWIHDNLSDFSFDSAISLRNRIERLDNGSYKTCYRVIIGHKYLSGSPSGWINNQLAEKILMDINPVIKRLSGESSLFPSHRLYRIINLNHPSKNDNMIRSIQLVIIEKNKMRHNYIK